MKRNKLFLALLLALVIACPAWATVGIYRDGVPYGQATDLDFTGFGTTGITNDGSKFTFPLVLAGVDNSGSSSIGNTVDAITDVGYSLIYKDLPAYNTGTSLPNGIPGQILTITIGTDAGATWYHIQPVTKTGFNFLEFNDSKDTATLQYVDSTVGWIILNLDSVTRF